MAPKYHPTPLSGGDRKALNKDLGKARPAHAPPAQIRALHPDPRHQVPRRSDWLHEIKHYGYRLTVQRDRLRLTVLKNVADTGATPML